MAKKKYHIGTSGWSYKDWVGVFYPKEIKPADWISYYAKTFDCTEINGCFYRLPHKQTVVNWVNKTPDDFLFCPKMSRYLTHYKSLKDPEEPLERFFGIFKPMQGKLGPVLIQLPKQVAFDRIKTEYFYKLLAKKYGKNKFAMEVRHESWLTEESYDLMRQYKISFVISHSGNHFPYREVITATDIYFRFHGPTSKYDSKYSEEEMKSFASIFDKWLQNGHELWVFFNNDWFGYGIENALQLDSFLKK